MKLSSFLRYQLYENNDKTTPLTDEINALSNFLNLEELRRENFTAVINQDIRSFSNIFIPQIYLPLLWKMLLNTV